MENTRKKVAFNIPSGSFKVKNLCKHFEDVILLKEIQTPAKKCALLRSKSVRDLTTIQRRNAMMISDFKIQASKHSNNLYESIYENSAVMNSEPERWVRT